MVICPRAELEGAVLLVKGKMLDLNLTGAFVDGWRKPVDAAIEKNNGIGEDCYLIGTISATRRGRKRKKTLESVCESISEECVINTAIMMTIRRKLFMLKICTVFFSIVKSI